MQQSMQISLLCSTEHKEENMIFVNSPFKILDEAFRGLYPDKKYKACIEPSIKDDEGNRQVKELTSSEEIEQAVELFVQIRVGEETDIYVTDKYHSISLFFDDGEKVVFSLNGDSLEYRKNGKTELYQLENIEQFWKEVMI